MNQDDIPPVEELYETILNRSSLPLPGFENYVKDKALRRALRIHSYLQDRHDRLDEECLMCGRQARGSQSRYAYDTPWDDRATEKYFCSEECGDSFMYEEPYAYFWCMGCDRQVCEQNPDNGWHTQYRDYKGAMVCLSCYQDMILSDGVERDELESGNIPGMFFSYGNTEAVEAGYREVAGFDDFYIDSRENADRFRKKALEMMDEGKKVVIGYERMAFDGSEGYVTMMIKEGD